MADTTQPDPNPPEGSEVWSDPTQPEGALPEPDVLARNEYGWVTASGYSELTMRAMMAERDAALKKADDFHRWFDQKDDEARALEEERDALRRELEARWQPIETAPKVLGRFIGLVDGRPRFVCWGKASHVPMYGWIVTDQGPEDADLCEPTHWMPLPAPPAGTSADAETQP